MITSDILTWSKEYKGEKFHGVLCDPPYELGFMGKAWDKQGVAFNPETWRLIKQHLYPGAFLMAFGGSRTYHRLACAIEDAGFEIRDCIVYCYGCLSEDTEILTINGWERYHKDIVNNLVLCYNININSYEFHKPTRDFIYENEYPAYRIQSDFTDQIVSRNHRVVIEREGKFLFKTAEELAREQEANIPILESLSALPTDIPCLVEGTSIKKQDLLEKMCLNERATTEKITDGKTKNDRGKMSLRKIILDIQLLFEKYKNSSLFKTLQWIRQGEELNKIQQQRTWKEASRERIIRFKKSCLERWNNLFQKTWKLQTDKVCSVSERISDDGEKGRLYNGASSFDGSKNETIASTNRGGSSYQPRSAGQQIGKSDAIFKQQGTQTPRSTRAKITEIEYKGKVWCVEVPTGAFVARRNGKMFITGNSGFPKSLNIGKQVDKEQGNEREVVGKGSCGYQVSISKTRVEQGYRPNLTKATKETIISKGHSPFEGYGTALKPAIEPIVVARVPLEGTNAQNALKYGCGGLDIEGGRIGVEKISTHNAPKGTFAGGELGRGSDTESYQEHQGRWPANLLLDDSEEVKRMFPETKVGARKSGQLRHTKKGDINFTGNTFTVNDYPSNEGSASRFFFQAETNLDEADPLFYTAKVSSRERNAGLDGFEPQREADRIKDDGVGGDNPRNRSNKPKINFHPTLKPISLTTYLAKLIKPPKEYHPRLLVPFAGVASEMIGGYLAGWNEVVGIEQDSEYCAIGEARIKYWTTKPKQTELI